MEALLDFVKKKLFKHTEILNFFIKLFQIILKLLKLIFEMSFTCTKNFYLIFFLVFLYNIFLHCGIFFIYQINNSLILG